MLIAGIIVSIAVAVLLYPIYKYAMRIAGEPEPLSEWDTLIMDVNYARINLKEADPEYIGAAFHDLKAAEERLDAYCTKEKAPVGNQTQIQTNAYIITLREDVVK